MSTKTIFFNNLKTFFKEKDYKYVGGYAPKFIKKTDEYIIMNIFNYLTNTNTINGGKLLLSINIIEDIILDVKYPNQGFDSFLEKKNDYLITTVDRSGDISFQSKPLESDIVIAEQANNIKEYVKIKGQIFEDKFTYLPNILEEMDKLQEEGLNWNDRKKGVLFGALDAYFRGLIISKLCNDINFQEKIQIMDKKFNQKGYEAWVPHYEELKEKLQELKPIY